MNKIFSIAFLCSAALSFTACVNEEDDLFDKSAAERLNEASALYSERLTASPNGWAVQLYPTTQDESPYGNGYLLMFRFHKDKSVDASMNNSLSDGKYITDTSSWDVITDNGPVLTFNTYNKVVHTFSDPEDLSSTGTKDSPNDETGTGLGGDYEFIIVDAPEDASYMMLKGKKRGTYNLLTPVPEGIDYESYLGDVKNFQATMFPANNPADNYYHFGDSVFVFADGGTGVPAIYPVGSDRVTSSGFNPFLITKRDNEYYLRFRDSKALGDKSIQEYRYDAEKDQFISDEDPSCYICGEDPLTFIDSNLLAGNTWKMTSTTAASESVEAMYREVVNGFRSLKLTFNGINISTDKDGNATLKFTYRQGNNSSSSDFNFSYQKNDDGIAFHYESASAASQNVLKSVPAIQKILDLFSQKLKVAAGTTSFNLRTIKLVPENNPDGWFVISL